MRKLTYIIILLLAIGGLFAISAQSKDGIRVRIGHQKQIDRGKLNLRFLSVVEDSRCPANVQCIWAGNAKIKVQISKYGGTPKTFELNTGIEPRSVLVEGCEIKLIGLTPEPRSNIHIDRKSYIATIEVVTNPRPATR